ncbi:MAG: hypothetical protein AAGF12_29795 [Myxococcota bacterium]
MTRRLAIPLLAMLMGCQGTVDSEEMEPLPMMTERPPTRVPSMPDASVDARSQRPDSSVPTDAAVPPDAEPDPPDAMVDAASATCPAMASRCIDFESPLSGGVSIDQDRGANGRISTERAFEGTSSFHATVPGTGGARALLVIPLPSELETTFYGRARFYFDSPTNDGHTYYIRASGPDPVANGQTAAYRLDGVGYDNSSRGTTHFNGRFESQRSNQARHGGVRTGTVDVTNGQWFCVEWRYDGSANEIRYWIDGTEEPSLAVTGSTEGVTWAAPEPFRELHLGVRQFHANNGQTSNVWVDTVALGPHRLGC